MPLLFQLSTPDSVSLLVNVRQFNLVHVLFQSAQQRQLEKGLAEKFDLVTHLGADVRVHLEDQDLHLVHGVVDLVRLHRHLAQPLGDRPLDARAALNLPRNALLGVIQRWQQHLITLTLLQLGRRFLQEHPWVREGGLQGGLEQLKEALQLPVHNRVEGLEDEFPNGLVFLNELGVLRVEHAEQLLIRRALQALHELDDGVLLLLEEPLDTLPNVGDALLKRQVGIVVQQFHHHVGPCDGAHGDTERLEHIPLFGLDPDLREPQKGLHLEHEPGVLRTAVDGNVERGHLDVVPQVVYVILQSTEVG
mmetsp:Transcript_1095/g.2659  ORF Transcript_1095/g.2659 Transcript_1095/m.2659 type:complete len:306 (+) Transcript_1095:358-1275(+)